MLIEHDRDRAARAVYFSQEAFTNTSLTGFNLTDTAAFSTPLTPGAHLYAADCPISQEEKDDTATRPCLIASWWELWHGLRWALAKELGAP